MTNQYALGYKAGLDAAAMEAYKVCAETRHVKLGDAVFKAIAALPVPDHLPDATKKVEPPKLRRAGSFGE